MCYCIEPGLSRDVGDTYYGFGEDFWDNYPSQYNNTIQPDDIKLLLGRIMQYGYQGNLSTSWRSQNDSDADKLAHAFATQLLVWETVVGERDADFDHVSTGSYDEILSLVSPNHPLYSRIMDYYDSIESSVQSHAVCPSFMSRSSGGAKTIELAWDGSQYIAELTDTNRVLSQFTFSASETGFHFSVSGNTLTITTDTAPTGNVTISASRSASRCGVLVWTDYKYGPNGGVQDTITYTASVSDPVRAFVKLKVSYGSAKIIKTSEDGRVDGITFTITGEGVNQTVTTDRNGEIRIDNLMPGVYTVTEQSYDKYVPQESHRVTVLTGQTATVSFNNVLRRGDLTVTKTSEDGLNQGVKFHLFGTSLSGLPVDEFAVTDENGVATFKDVLIGTGYTLEEMDAAIRYVIPDSQSAAVEWNSVTNEAEFGADGTRVFRETEALAKDDSEIESLTDEELDALPISTVKDGEVVTYPNAEALLDDQKELLVPPPQVKRSSGVAPHVLHPEINTEYRTNFQIESDDIGVGTPLERFYHNIRAIQLLNKLDAESRLATPTEQRVLADYVGWGGLSEFFKEDNPHYTELKNVLSDEEYASARESTLTAFYTPPVVIKAVYSALENMHFQTGNVLEPSCGIGNFMGLVPESMNDAKFYGVELDNISGRIAQQLYQKNSIAVQGFENTNLPDSFFDAAIGNVPFGQFKVPDKRYDKHNFLIDKTLISVFCCLIYTLSKLHCSK